MCLLSNTLHQAILDAIIEIFSCSAVFVFLWFASIFVYPFSCYVLLEIQAHGLLLHSSVFVGGLCAVWERPKGLSRPLTDLIKSDRAKRGSDWEIERGKPRRDPAWLSVNSKTMWFEQQNSHWSFSLSVEHSADPLLNSATAACSGRNVYRTSHDLWIGKKICFH